MFKGTETCMKYLCALLLYCLPLLASAESVDTTALANIRAGMQEAEVVQRLGQPDAIQRGPRIESRQRLGRGEVEVTERQRYSYYYRGDSQYMSAWVYFEDGVVLQTAKRRE